MIEKTFDPIISVGDYENKFFAQIPVLSNGTEIIMHSSASQGKLLITKDTEVKPMDLYRGKYDKIITVDVGAHAITFHERYASCRREGDFIIRVEAAEKVVKSDVVWESGIHDVASALETEMSADLRNVASGYPIDMVDTLQHEIKRQMENNTYLSEVGIQILRIDYDVRLEEKYETLRKNETYEKWRVDSAQSIRNLYKDNETAIFAEVAIGTKTPEQAVQDLKREYASDFDERVRRARVITDLLEDMRENDLVDEEVARAQINNLLGTLQGKKGSMLEQRETESNERNESLSGKSGKYAPFDD